MDELREEKMDKARAILRNERFKTMNKEEQMRIINILVSKGLSDSDLRIIIGEITGEKLTWNNPRMNTGEKLTWNNLRVNYPDLDRLSLISNTDNLESKWKQIGRIIKATMGALDFVLESELGQGFFATTYASGNKAIKVINWEDLPNPKFFVPEFIVGKLAREYCGDNVVNIDQVYIDVEAKRTYGIMRLIKGKQLDKIDLTSEEKHSVYEKLKALMECLHKHDIYHRDIRAENILIDDYSKDVYLLDFGISRIINNDFFDTVLGLEKSGAISTREKAISIDKGRLDYVRKTFLRWD